MNRERVKLYKTEDWHKDMGDCLFFAFLSMQEPPQVYCGTPLDSMFNQFKEMFNIEWTHFIQLDFNHIFEQTQGPDKV